MVNLSQDMSCPSISVLGMRVDMIQTSDVIEVMEHWIADRSYGHDIVVSNANDAIICKKDSLVKEAVNNSSLSVPDGISLVLLARLRGFPLRKRVYGPDLMFEFLKKADKEGYSSFFYGSSIDVQKKLMTNLQSQFPHLQVVGSYAPPFRELTREEEDKVIAEINQSSPDILWVGLGCPKQQLWMHRNKNKLRVPVVVGVGAAFDFFAKTKPQAPRWLRDHGFEWLFRLATEPKRLWKRYFVNGTLFICYAFGELMLWLFKKDKEKTHV